MPSLDIDLISDVVCPWCYIGTKNLDQALEELPDVTATVRFRPFLLDPGTPPEGADLREYLQHKMGADPAPMLARTETAARAAGIALDYAKIRRVANTTRAHTLLRHALAQGPEVQGPLARALYRAYFLEAQDIGQIDVLAELAAKHGLPEAEVRKLLADEGELAETTRLAAYPSTQGIKAVPFFIFGRKLALSGAQAVTLFRTTIERAAAAT